MKKILLFLMTVCAFASMDTAKAQCTINIANVSITKMSGPDQVVGPPAGCQYKFNASFDIIANNGFKYLFFHSWQTAAYVPSFDCSGHQNAANIPTSATLGTAINDAARSFMDFGFIGLDALTITSTPQIVTSQIAATYPGDPTVVMNNVGATATVFRKGTSDTLHFDVSNITIVLNGTCPATLGSVSTDIWGSNSSSGIPKAQCYICGRIQNFDNPSIALQKSCSGGATPFNQWQVGLTNLGTDPVNATFRVYIDKDNDNIKEPGGDDTLIFTSGLEVFNPNQLRSFGPTQLPSPYCCIQPWADYGVYVTVTLEGSQNAVESPIIIQGCATLPIKLKSFDATRNKSNVNLKWETSIEENNKGFDIQRLIGAGGWQTIGFVASKAQNGNSTSEISYDFTDVNNNVKGVSQYRLRQVDRDGKNSMSQIRSVRGETQKNSTIVYPNPSNDGKINILFDEVSTSRNVTVVDVSGRTIKQINGVSNNNVQIDNLDAGFYVVRITDVQTGEQVVQKFVVNKH